MDYQQTVQSDPTTNSPQSPPKLKSKLFLFILLGLLIIGFFSGSYYLLTDKGKLPTVPTPALTKTSCNTDHDCGIDTCSCKALRKEFINQEKNICLTYCGQVKCLDHQCVLEE